MGPTEKIEDVDVFQVRSIIYARKVRITDVLKRIQNYIVVYGRREGLPMILCHNLETLETHNVDLPEKFCVLQPGTNLVCCNDDCFLFYR